MRSSLRVARASLGAVLLLRPNAVLTAMGCRRTRSTTIVARLLGARQLAQAALTRSRRADTVGAVVDALHLSSLIATAALSPRWRRAALVDAAAATTLLAGGVLVRNTTGNRP
jgi:hypothetical protein